MFKKVGMVAALILSLSTGVMAGDKTVIEESWEKYISTPEVEYSQNKGKLETWVGAGASLSEGWDQAFEKWGYGGVDFVYSLSEKMEVHGLVTGDKYVNLDPFGKSEETEGLVQGTIKGKVYDANGFSLAIRGGVAHSRGENGFGSSKTTVYAVDAYSANQLGRRVSLFNNVGVSTNGQINVRVQNGLEFTINDRNTLKARVQTNYDAENKHADVNMSAALKSAVAKDTTNLLIISVPGDLAKTYLSNTLETKTIPGLLLSGRVEVEKLQQTTNAHFNLNAEKTLGIVTLKAGLEHYWPKEESWRIATLQAGMEVNVTKNLHLVIDVKNEKWYYPEVLGYNDPSALISVNYEI